MLRVPGHRQHLKGVFKYLLTLTITPEMQETPGTPFGDVGSGGSHFGELILPHEHWCLQMSYWELSLWLIGARALTHQQVSTSLKVHLGPTADPRPNPADEWASR